ncbi:MAG: protein kinase [Chitinivibrionales bacterium]|nr:protein kinase [Chitinivibrionales bacterium]
MFLYKVDEMDPFNTINSSQAVTNTDVADISTFSNRYRVVRKLGQGGMGKVYLVQDSLRIGRLLALKTICELASNPQTLKRFKQEFLVMTRLRHPNLIRVYDFGFDEKLQTHYLTMDYIEGSTLADRVKQSGPVPGEEIFSIAVDICRTLSFIHSRSIVHRDINPSNIMLSNGQVVLMDFGLSDTAVGESTNLKGTLGYLAPEAIHGVCDLRTDIFAVGLTLYWIASSESLYDGMDAQSICTLIGESERFLQFKKERLCRINDTRLAKLIDELVGFFPHDRPQSCTAIIALINTLVGGSIPFETTQTKMAYVTATAFVGRQQELSYLIEHFKQCGRGGHKGLWVKGDAGIGKTRLFQEFKNYCQIHAILFTEGTCYQSMSRLFGPFIPIISELLFSAPPEVVAQFGPKLTGVIFNHPVLVPFYRAVVDDTDHDYGVVVKALAQMILESAACFTHGCVIYINDMQWSDSGTIDLLNALLRQVDKYYSAFPLSFCISSRMDDTAALETVRAVHHLNVLTLQVFDDKRVSSYIESIFGSQNISATLHQAIGPIHSKVGGNPFHLQQLIKYMIETDSILRNEQSWELTEPIETIGIPKKLEEIIETRLHNLKLEPDEVRMLEIMAFLVRRISWEELFQITSVHHQFLVKLEELEIIKSEQISDNTVYKISHDLIRETIIKRLDPQYCRKLHDIIAQRLELIHKDDISRFEEDICHHYRQAQNREKMEVYLERVANKALKNCELKKALDLFTQLREITDDQPGQRRVSLLMNIGRIHGALNNWNVAFDHCIEILPFVQKNGGPSAVAQVYQYLIYCGRALKKPSREVTDFFDKAVQQYQSVNDIHGISLCYNSMGDYYFETCNEYESAMDCHSKGLALARQVDSRIAVMVNLGNLSRIQYSQGHFDEAIATISESLTIAQTMLKNATTAKDEFILKFNIAYGWNQRGVFNLAKKDYPSALNCFSKQLTVAQESDLIHEKVTGFLGKAQSLLMLNRITEAAEYCDNAMASCIEANNPELSTEITILKARLLFATADHCNAVRMLNELLLEVKEQPVQADINFELWRMNCDDLCRQESLRLYRICVSRVPFYLFKERIRQLEENRCDTPFSLPAAHGAEVAQVGQQAGELLDMVRQCIDQTASHLCSVLPGAGEGPQQEQLKVGIQRSFAALHETLNSALSRHNSASVATSADMEIVSALKELIAAARNLNSSIELSYYLKELLDLCIRWFCADRGCIILFDENKLLQSPIVRSRQGHDIAPMPISKTIMNRMIREQKTFIIDDVPGDEELDKSKSIAVMRLQSIVCIPIENRLNYEHRGVPFMADEILIGILYLDKKIDQSSDRRHRNGPWLDFYQTIGDCAALAIHLESTRIQIEQGQQTLQQRLSQTSAELTLTQKKLWECEAKIRLLKMEHGSHDHATLCNEKNSQETSAPSNTSVVIADVIDETLLINSTQFDLLGVSIQKTVLDTVWLTTEQMRLSELLETIMRHLLTVLEQMPPNKRCLSIEMQQTENKIDVFLSCPADKDSPLYRLPTEKSPAEAETIAPDAVQVLTTINGHCRANFDEKRQFQTVILTLNR